MKKYDGKIIDAEDVDYLEKLTKENKERRKKMSQKEGVEITDIKGKTVKSPEVSAKTKLPFLEMAAKGYSVNSR